MPGQTQIAIAFPVLVVVLFFVHITLLRQPAVHGGAVRGVLGDPGTYMVVIATRTEAAKRRGELDGDEPHHDGDH